MDQVLFCDSCGAFFHKNLLSLHVEAYHVAPRQEEVIRLNCGDCKFSCAVVQKDFMIRHCLKTGHDIEGVITEWKSFWVTEEARIGEVLIAGFILLHNDRQRREAKNSANYRTPEFSCQFNPLKRPRDEGKVFHINGNVPTETVDKQPPQKYVELEEGKVSVSRLGHSDSPKRIRSCESGTITSTTSTTGPDLTDTVSPTAAISDEEKKDEAVSKENDRPNEKPVDKSTEIFTEPRTSIQNTPEEEDEDDDQLNRTLTIDVSTLDSAKPSVLSAFPTAETTLDVSDDTESSFAEIEGDISEQVASKVEEENQSDDETSTVPKSQMGGKSSPQAGKPISQGSSDETENQDLSSQEDEIIRDFDDANFDVIINKTIMSTIASTSAPRMCCMICQKTISTTGRKANLLVKAIGHCMCHLPNLQIFKCRYCHMAFKRRCGVKSHLLRYHNKQGNMSNYVKSGREEDAAQIRNCMKKAFPDFNVDQRTNVLAYAV